jgi:hypothetical protein
VNGVEDGWAEEDALYERWGLNDSAILALGFNRSLREMKVVLGSVPQAPPHRLQDEAAQRHAVAAEQQQRAERVQEAGTQAPPVGLAAAGPRAGVVFAIAPGLLLLLLLAMRRHRLGLSKRPSFCELRGR